MEEVRIQVVHKIVKSEFFVALVSWLVFFDIAVKIRRRKVMVQIIEEQMVVLRLA